jgi:uncharacterized membrane protein
MQNVTLSKKGAGVNLNMKQDAYLICLFWICKWVVMTSECSGQKDSRASLLYFLFYLIFPIFIYLNIDECLHIHMYQSAYITFLYGQRWRKHCF